MAHNTSGLIRTGRPKGVLNKATREIKAFSHEVLTDPDYVWSLKERLRRGTAPHMEVLLHHYAYGKPRERVEVSHQQPEPFTIVVTGSNGRSAHTAPSNGAGDA